MILDDLVILNNTIEVIVVFQDL